MQNEPQVAPVVEQVFSDSVKKRFWAKVNKNGPIQPHCPELGQCWEWTAYLNEKGYGNLFISGKRRYAHRFSWWITNGPIPLGMCALHKCDNRKCCNPSHLFLGTKSENYHDMIVKNRDYRGTLYGEKHGNAKLTWGKVAEIRSRYRAGGVSQRKLAAEYGVAQPQIRRVVNNKGWFEAPPTDTPKHRYLR